MRVDAAQRAVDSERLVVASPRDQGLAVEPEVPLLGGVELRRAAAQRHGLRRVGVEQQRGQGVVGCGEGRVGLDGPGIGLAGPQRVAVDGFALDSLGVETERPQRVVVRAARRTDVASGDERRGEEEREDGDSCGALHGRSVCQRADSNWRRNRTSFSK